MADINWTVGYFGKEGKMLYQIMKRLLVLLPLIGLLFIADLATPLKSISAEKADAITIPLSNLIREDRIIPNVNPNGITSLAVSLDGSVIATGTHSDVLLWDYASGNHIKILTDQSFWGRDLYMRECHRRSSSLCLSMGILRRVPSLSTKDSKRMASKRVKATLYSAPDHRRCAANKYLFKK